MEKDIDKIVKMFTAYFNLDKQSSIVHCVTAQQHLGSNDCALHSMLNFYQYRIKRIEGLVKKNFKKITRTL